MLSTSTITAAPAETPTIRRFGLMTDRVALLQVARTLAQASGYTVDLVPIDAPVPQAGTFDGIIVDFDAGIPHKLAREMFVDKITDMAKVFPVVAFGHRIRPAESGHFLAAGIKTFPTLRAKMFTELLTRSRIQPTPIKVEPPVEAEEVKHEETEVASTAE